MSENLHAFLRDDEGLTIVEYAIAAGLMTAVVALSFVFLAEAAENVIHTISHVLNNHRCCD